MTLIAECKFRVPALDFRCRMPASIRVISSPAAITAGAELWLEQRVLKILPVAIGLKALECVEGKRVEWRMFHGPFKELSYAAELDEADPEGGRAHATLRAGLPWCYGGKLAERVLLEPLIRSFLRCACFDNEITICNS